MKTSYTSINKKVNRKKPKQITTILMLASSLSVISCNSGTKNNMLSEAVQNNSYASNNGMITYNPKEIEEKRKRREEKYKELKQDMLHPETHATHDAQKGIDTILDEVHSEYWTNFHGMGGRIIMLDSETDLAQYLQERGIPLDDTKSMVDINGNKISLNEHNIFINNHSADGIPKRIEDP